MHCGFANYQVVIIVWFFQRKDQRNNLCGHQPVLGVYAVIVIVWTVVELLFTPVVFSTKTHSGIIGCLISMWLVPIVYMCLFLGKIQEDLLHRRTHLKKKRIVKVSILTLDLEASVSQRRRMRVYTLFIYFLGLSSIASWLLSTSACH